jgi:hypothetical protein
MASGEMNDAEFLAFNSDWMNAALPWLCDGGVLGTSSIGAAIQRFSPQLRCSL